MKTFALIFCAFLQVHEKNKTKYGLTEIERDMKKCDRLL